MQHLKNSMLAIAAMAAIGLTTTTAPAATLGRSVSSHAMPKPLASKDSEFSKRGIIIVSGKGTAPGSDRMLNPQPLPPRDATASKSIVIVGKSVIGSDRMLNPQP